MQFYNDDDQLIYEEKIAGIKFNFKRSKTSKWLKDGLEKALFAFDKSKQPVYDETWMAMITNK